MKKILIANRGEIALRIVRACRDAGYASVAIAAAADRQAPHARLADECHFLNGTSPRETYLNQEAILDIALRSGADAIHPGYGFLSENEAFAAAVEATGLTWIGPPADAIARLGDKVAARAIARQAGAALLPSLEGALTPDSARAFVAEHGLPVIVKAQNGGGGRGMRIVREPAELEVQIAAAGREAQIAFGRAECFLERYVEHARHVETQCLADCHGRVVVLSTRDCTLQRRQQKLVEEAPAPFLSAGQQASLVDVSVRILSASGYRGAGTCEFLLAPEGEIFFLEVNTRVQVEHPGARKSPASISSAPCSGSRKARSCRPSCPRPGATPSSSASMRRIPGPISGRRPGALRSCICLPDQACASTSAMRRATACRPPTIP